MNARFVAFAVASATLLGAPPTAGAAEMTAASGSFAKLSHKNGLGSLPEASVVYRIVPYVATEDVHTVIRGRAPRARLWAFSIYESLVSPIAVLPDRDVRAAPGGTYAITIRRGCGGAPNCLDASRAVNPALGRYGYLVLRLYHPVDLGRAETGGVPLPAVTYVGSGPDAAVDLAAVRLPTEPPVAEGILSAAVDSVRTLAASNGPFPAVVSSPDNDPQPRVEPMRNTKDAYLSWLGERGVPRPLTDALRRIQAPALDGQFAGVNRYVGTTFDLSRGNLELRFRAPTYRRPRWGGGPRNRLWRMNGHEQLRYWSVCAYKAHLQESGCRRDAQFAVGRDRQVALVLAPRCPVAGYANCLATGSTTLPDFLVLIRNTLPSRSFADRQVTGSYAIRARYIAR